MEKKLFALYRDYRNDPVMTIIMTSLQKQYAELIAYRGIAQAPLTTNLIECYNAHLESRLFSIKGFESFAHAKLWLNGYILKRRFTKLTGCTGKFIRLNGFTSIEKTKKE